MLQDRVAEFLKAHPDISSKGDMYFRSRSPHPVRLPIAFSNDLCRLIGWIHGDGNMSYRRMLVSDESLGFHRDVLGPTFEKLFGIKTNIFHDENRNTYYSHLKNSVLYDYLTEVLEIPKGSVRNGLMVPAYIRGLGLQFRAKYVGGLYDAESHVKKRQAEIDFSSTCGAIQREVGMTLGELDIGRTLSDRQRTSREFEVYIYGKGDLRRFDTYVGYAHPVKKQALMRALTPPLNTRVVPAVNDAS
jgi:LAGLIDADG-like domain